jgi:Domain of unknown function (DUF4388)/PilZ domain
MPYTGRLEERPLLDVIQIIAYSQQSGILSIKGPKTKGLLIFEGGNVVCAYSPSALALLVKAAKESEERHRLTYRRIQILTALRELFDLPEGNYRFVRRDEPVPELEGLDLRSFYAAGALDTGDLLLVLEKAMDEELEVAPAAKPTDEDKAHADQRRFPRYGPVVIRGVLRVSETDYPGFLTNMSEGGTFYHADELPPADSAASLDFELPWELGRCRVSVTVVWIRSEGPDTKRGAGLSFVDFEGDSREQLASYLERFEALAQDVDFEA